MTLARATVALLIALLLAIAAMTYWLDRRGAKRLRVTAAELRNETAGLRSSIVELRNEAAGIRSSIVEQRNEIALLRSATGVSLQPTSIELGPADTYERLDHNWKSIGDASGRAAVPCIDGGPLRPLVIVTLGQSNAANHGQGLYAPKHRVDNFNLYDGKCYKAVEPLLGPSGEGGNFATRLADMLIERRLAARVVVAPIAMGGTTVEQWALEGVFNRRIPASIRRLYDAGLSPTTSSGTRAKATPPPAMSTDGSIARTCSRSLPAFVPTASMLPSLWPWLLAALRLRTPMPSTSGTVSEPRLSVSSASLSAPTPI
jgi:hypothetical protein